MSSRTGLAEVGADTVTGGNLKAFSWYIDTQRNARAFRGLCVDAKDAANFRGALLHPFQSKVPALHEGRGVMGETAPIVINRKLDCARVVTEGYVDDGSAGVMHGIVHCLLGDAKKLVFYG